MFTSDAARDLSSVAAAEETLTWETYTGNVDTLLSATHPAPLIRYFTWPFTADRYDFLRNL